MEKGGPPKNSPALLSGPIREKQEKEEQWLNKYSKYSENTVILHPIVSVELINPLINTSSVIICYLKKHNKQNQNS